MKEKWFIGLIIISLIFLSACQSIETAVQDTFATQPKKFNAEAEAKEQGFFEKLINMLFDESNQRVSIFDIESDAEAKLGITFSNNIQSHLRQYVNQHDLTRYLSEEEIVAILQELNDQNLLLNIDQLAQIKEELIQKIGHPDPLVYQGMVSFSPDKVSLQLIDHTQPEQVDEYSYETKDGTWRSRPVKLSGGIKPSDQAVALSDIPLESVQKIVDFSLELMKETGDYQVFDSINRNIGPYRIYTQPGIEGLVFQTRLQGIRADYDLTFDLAGNLLEKVKR